MVYPRQFSKDIRVIQNKAKIWIAGLLRKLEIIKGRTSIQRWQIPNWEMRMAEHIARVNTNTTEAGQSLAATAFGMSAKPYSFAQRQRFRNSISESCISFSIA